VGARRRSGFGGNLPSLISTEPSLATRSVRPTPSHESRDSLGTLVLDTGNGLERSLLALVQVGVLGFPPPLVGVILALSAES
jgi:hypothetical protein